MTESELSAKGFSMRQGSMDADRLDFANPPAATRLDRPASAEAVTRSPGIKNYMFGSTCSRRRTHDSQRSDSRLSPHG